MGHEQLVWDHFKFNAEQRLKAFNFFLLLATFANGGVVTAIEKHLSPFLLIILGGFLVLLSVVFWLADKRSRGLLWLSVDALRDIEALYPAKSQLFRLDAEQRNPYIRYTVAISTLLVAQCVFGMGVAIFGASKVWS